MQKNPNSTEVQRQYFNEFGQHLYKSVARFAGQISEAGNETVVKTKFSRRSTLDWKGIQDRKTNVVQHTHAHTSSHIHAIRQATIQLHI